MHVAPVSKVERVVQQLEEEGYDDGPGASRPLLLKEGDMLEIGFRGNLHQRDTDEDVHMVYNSQMNTICRLGVEEVNKYLQKNFAMFRGFIQVYKKSRVRREADDEEFKDGGSAHAQKYTKELLCEHIVQIPKESQWLTSASRVRRAPVVIKNPDDPVNDVTLRDLAHEMGEEWPRVANQLNVKRMRIQAILRDTRRSSSAHVRDDEAKYDMLITWAKRVPRGFNKAAILKDAFISSGRFDLADHLDELVMDFYRQRASSRAQTAHT